MAERKSVKDEKVKEKEERKEDAKPDEKPDGKPDAKPEEAQKEEAGEEAEEETAAKEKKEKKPKKDKKTQQMEELKDRLIRSMAEFDNYRKRSEKEKAQMFEVGAKSVLEKLLPVLDNFERGLQSVSEGEKENAFVQGMEKTYRHFMTTLEEIGVQPIEAVGKEFDTDLHNAVMHTEDESLGANLVTEELQKGYTYRESVIRHSMVKVVN